MKTTDRLIVEKEIQQEKAEALGRAGERLERALMDLATLREDLVNLVRCAPASPLTETEGVTSEIGEALERYARLRKEAKQLRYCLIIQREALGLWKHEDVDRLYPIPAPQTLPRMIQPGDGR